MQYKVLEEHYVHQLFDEKYSQKQYYCKNVK